MTALMKYTGYKVNISIKDSKLVWKIFIYSVIYLFAGHVCFLVEM